MSLRYHAICEYCNFKALTRTKWEVHLRSKKHLRGGKSKVENYFCEKCGYWCMHKYNLNIHKVVCHGLIEEKKHAPFYCEICNRAFYCKLFYDNHNISVFHKNVLKRLSIIDNSHLKDIDTTLIDKNYMLYIDELKTKLKTSLYVFDKKAKKLQNYQNSDNILLV